MMFSPFEQFEIVFYFNKMGTSWNNFNLYLLLSLILLYKLSTNMTFSKNSYIMVTIVSLLQSQMMNLLKVKYNKYLPLLTFMFWLILLNNLLGLIPYNFTMTSQMIYTLYMSLVMILSVTLLGMYLHGIYFITLFIPKNMSAFLLPMIFIMEMMSYLSSMMSLSLSLSANMMSGHMLLFMMSSFLFKSMILLPLAIIIMSLFILLELGVSLIQAYVFFMLTVNYLKDSLYLH